MAINMFVCSGNLVRDAELSRGQGGIDILRFTVAWNEPRKKADGEYEYVPSYFDCVMFGNRATKLAGYLTKGKKVVVAGKARQSRWERDGQKRSKVEFVINDVELPPREQGQFAQPSGTPETQNTFYDADMPF